MHVIRIYSGRREIEMRSQCDSIAHKHEKSFTIPTVPHNNVRSTLSPNTARVRERCRPTANKCVNFTFYRSVCLIRKWQTTYTHTHTHIGDTTFLWPVGGGDNMFRQHRRRCRCQWPMPTCCCQTECVLLRHKQRRTLSAHTFIQITRAVCLHKNVVGRVRVWG